MENSRRTLAPAACMEDLRIVIAGKRAGNLRQRALWALTRSLAPDLHSLDVEACDETLVIYGVVSSFYHKQLAQEAVRAECRDARIVNSVCVG